MRNDRIRTFAAVLWIKVLVQAAPAAPIDGSIGFVGNFNQDGGTIGNLATAQRFSIGTFPGNYLAIISANGSFAGATSPTFAQLIGVNGNPPSLVGSQLWSVVVSGVTNVLTVTTESQVFATAQSLALQGDGIISDGNPADDTPGNWTLQFSVAGATFTWLCTDSATPEPTVTTGAATDITANSARLSGSVNPNAFSTSAFFQWGTSTNYGIAGASWELSGSTTSNLTMVATGLISAVTYHFRLAAHNDNGTNYGADQMFITLPPPLQLNGVIQFRTNLNLSWNTVSGQTYQVQFNQDLTHTNWINFGGHVNATSSMATATDVMTNKQRFYRVVAQ